MVSSLIKNENALIDEDMDDISQEKHRQLLQTITNKTKRKYNYIVMVYNILKNNYYNLI